MFLIYLSLHKKEALGKRYDQYYENARIFVVQVHAALLFLLRSQSIGDGQL